MADDLRRLSYLPDSLYNFHPGSHVKQGAQKGIELIAQTLNQVMTDSLTTTVLLETMAGKGTEVGRTFEELQAILERTDYPEKMGVCLDTCHVRVIGLYRLKAIHLNDSKNPMGSHKDRHEKIGEGSLTLEAITRIINHPLLKDLPFFLETPNELPGYQAEIRLLKSKRTE